MNSIKNVIVIASLSILPSLSYSFPYSEDDLYYTCNYLKNNINEYNSQYNKECKCISKYITVLGKGYSSSDYDIIIRDILSNYKSNNMNNISIIRTEETSNSLPDDIRFHIIGDVQELCLDE